MAINFNLIIIIVIVRKLSGCYIPINFYYPKWSGRWLKAVASSASRKEAGGGGAELMELLPELPSRRSKLHRALFSSSRWTRSQICCSSQRTLDSAFRSLKRLMAWLWIRPIITCYSNILLFRWLQSIEKGTQQFSTRRYKMWTGILIGTGKYPAMRWSLPVWKWPGVSLRRRGWCCASPNELETPHSSRQISL